ncbi:uncharacterized protein PG998_000151 [Apiospora kogelbergensis]|uniref:uncharacterized protein n=1 Tax=Apiospora kogelbergensis TaxID=1337665 RepID=UPI00312E55BD
MKLQRLTWMLGLVPLVSSADAPKGDSCKVYKGYNCAEPGTKLEPSADYDFDDSEKSLTGEKRAIDPRDVDFTTLDSETGINVTNLVRRQDYDHVDVATLHARVEDTLEANDADEEDGLVEAYRQLTNRGQLERRGGDRKLQVCLNKASMTYNAPPYPNAADDDYYDAKTWDDCQDYKLEKKTKAQVDRENAARKQKDPKIKDRTFADEHVLEIQLIKAFSLEKFGGTPRGAKPKGEVPSFPLAVQAHDYKEMCKYLSDFWNKGRQLSNVDNKKAWDFVGNAWPSRVDGAAHDGKEMIKLESRVNGVKARVQAFGWTAIYAKDEQDKAKMNIENADEFIKNIKEMILVSEYMKRDEVQKIFKAQGDRVKLKFKEVEEGLEKNWAKEPRKYIKQGLDTMWAKWLKEHVPKASKKLADEIAVHAGILETFIEQRELFEDIQKKKPEKDRVKRSPPKNRSCWTG